MQTICRALRRALHTVLRAVLPAVLVAAGLVGVLAAVSAPAAQADGDPGSDVLVYQNLFVTAYANMPIAEEVALGNLLTTAGKDGFPIRVAVISQASDLGAITALWDEPAAYARFLGVELSLAYQQRLLVVMPDGLGFYWQGHSTAAAYRILGKVRVAAGGAGLASTAETAVCTRSTSLMSVERIVPVACLWKKLEELFMMVS